MDKMYRDRLPITTLHRLLSWPDIVIVPRKYMSYQLINHQYFQDDPSTAFPARVKETSASHVFLNSSIASFISNSTSISKSVSLCSKSCVTKRMELPVDGAQVSDQLNVAIN